MYFDVAAATSLFALFVSTRPGKHIDHNVGNRKTDTLSFPRQQPVCLYRNTKTISTRCSPSSRAILSIYATAGTPAGRRDKNLMVPRIVEQEKYLALLEWLKTNGAEVNDCLEIKQSTQGEQAGYGVFVGNGRSVQKGELLFSVPRNLCVTIEKATSSEDDDGTFGEGLQNIIEKAGPGGSTVAMAGFMAKEYILMYLDEREKKIEEKINNSNDDDQSSRWGPYMKLLPWKRGINNQEHILFWNEAKVEELLGGSVSYLEAKSLREEVALSIQVLGPLLKRSVRMAKGDLSTSAFERFKSLLPWERYNKDASQDDLTNILDDQLIAEAIKGAFVTLLTRSFADDDGLDEDCVTDITGQNDDADDDIDKDNDNDDAYSEKLVPLLDLLQHSDTPNVRHKVVGSMESADARVEVRARCDIDAGSELWNQYRSEEDEAMPYSRFFTRCVFIVIICYYVFSRLRCIVVAVGVLSHNKPNQYGHSYSALSAFVLYVPLGLALFRELTNQLRIFFSIKVQYFIPKRLKFNCELRIVSFNLESIVNQSTFNQQTHSTKTEHFGAKDCYIVEK